MMVAHKFCTYCGAKLMAEFRFCPGCGKERYNETPPVDPFTLTVQWEYSAYREGDDALVRALFRLESCPEAIARYAALQSHLVMILDVSGSMDQSDKYPLLRQAVETMLLHLEDGISLSLILFSTRPQLLCQALPAAGARRRAADILQVMDTTSIRFKRTHLAPALDIALPLIRDSQTSHRDVVPRLYILTDGQLDDTDECQKRTVLLEELGIEANSYGFGRDFALETMKTVLGQGAGRMVKPIANTSDIVETFKHIVDVTGNIIATRGTLGIEYAEGVIPGDVFCHRPAVRYWPAEAMTGERLRVFEIGNIEAEREYVWAVEARLPYDAPVGSNLGTLYLSFYRDGNDAPLSWPLPVPMTADPLQMIIRDSDVTRIFDALEDQRDNSPAVLIRAYEARVAIARVEGRDPEYVAALEEVLAELKAGKPKSMIRDEVMRLADADGKTIDPRDRW